MDLSFNSLTYIFSNTIYTYVYGHFLKKYVIFDWHNVNNTIVMKLLITPTIVQHSNYICNTIKI